MPRTSKTWRTLYPLWKGACEHRGLGSPSRAHGISVDAGEQVAEYVSKWGLEDEMTKAHIKRSNKGFSMFDLVRAYQETGDEKYKRVFMVFIVLSSVSSSLSGRKA